MKNISIQQPILKEKILILLKEGRNIDAIKLYQEDTTCSLLEAKIYVENLIEEKFSKE